LAERV